MYRDLRMENFGPNPADTSWGPLPLNPTRRRRVRQRVHTPAYASLNQPESTQVLDLSEIVDISEEGIAIQTSSPLQARRDVNLLLDLSETKANIQIKGEVIWSDDSGRAGIHFPEMPDASRRQLKEWLFVNAMMACVHYAAEQPEEISRIEEIAPETLSQAEKIISTNCEASVLPEEMASTARPDYTSILAALAAVKREVEAIGADLDAAVQLIANRAEVFSHASGAAIALLEGGDMICRACAGRDAPGLGVRLKIGEGFSGECVRRGKLLRCEDSEIDQLVDRESCRALGIRSMIAVPIRWGAAIIGLLEVFSPDPYAFEANTDLILRRLAEMAAIAVHRAGAPDSPPARTANVDDEFPLETPADLGLPRLATSRKVLLTAAIAMIAFVAIWLLRPWNDNAGSSGPGKPAIQQESKAPPPSMTATSLEGLRRLAERGDATAQFAIGARYATGDDVTQDYSEAMRWFSRAAEQGHVVAQATLGAYYWAGRGVAPDLVKAYFWSVLAQAGGDEASKYRVAVLASRMSRGQVLSAQQQANDWIKQHQAANQNASAAR